MNGRYDRSRSAVALFAALLAGFAALIATSRASVPHGETTVALLTAESAVGLAFAAWPSGRPWSSRRRLLAFATGVVATVAIVPGPLISAIAVPGCVCPSSPPPLALGIGAQYWIITGLFGFPLLMFVAAAWRSRSTPARVEP